MWHVDERFWAPPASDRGVLPAKPPGHPAHWMQSVQLHQTDACRWRPDEASVSQRNETKKERLGFTTVTLTVTYAP